MNNKETTNENISMSNDTVLPPKKRKRSLHNSATAFPNAVRYKGVVQQHNGHWGAQLYTNHKRFWLGTFKSDIEAAMAYDSASIKLLNSDFDSHRNFPLSKFTIQELNFQKHYTTEDVLNMIKDGSYHRKFQEFFKFQEFLKFQIENRETKPQETNQDLTNCIAKTQLFEKELTASDVGKLNRLVIPKKYAMKYLSKYTKETETRSSSMEDMEIVVYDEGRKQWKFRYCYWKSSQSFVLTKGWIRFVKEKNLKEKDVVVFCEVTSTLEGQNGQKEKFLMIDIYRFNNKKEVMLFGVIIN